MSDAGLLLENTMPDAGMTNHHDLPDEGNRRPCSLDIALLPRVISTLAPSECLDQGQAQDVLWSAETVQQMATVSPSSSDGNKRMTLF
jgi:hypothetical protein